MTTATQYRFGCDGTMGVDEAAAFLSCSRSTLERRCRAGLIEWRLEGGRRIVCKKSMLDYLATLSG